jgi:hypothetical protein
MSVIVTASVQLHQMGNLGNMSGIKNVMLHRCEPCARTVSPLTRQVPLLSRYHWAARRALVPVTKKQSSTLLYQRFPPAPTSLAKNSPLYPFYTLTLYMICLSSASPSFDFLVAS